MKKNYENNVKICEENCEIEGKQKKNKKKTVTKE